MHAQGRARLAVSSSRWAAQLARRILGLGALVERGPAATLRTSKRHKPREWRARGHRPSEQNLPRAFSSVYNPELPLVQRRLIPEWAHPRMQQRSPSKLPANQMHNYEKIYGEYNSGDIEIVCAGFYLQSDGKLPEPVWRQTDAWLRTAARSSPRAVLALCYPNSDEVSKQAGFRKRR